MNIEKIVDLLEAETKNYHFIKDKEKRSDYINRNQDLKKQISDDNEDYADTVKRIEKLEKDNPEEYKRLESQIKPVPMNKKKTEEYRKMGIDYREAIGRRLEKYERSEIPELDTIEDLDKFNKDLEEIIRMLAESPANDISQSSEAKESRKDRYIVSRKAAASYQNVNKKFSIEKLCELFDKAERDIKNIKNEDTKDKFEALFDKFFAVKNEFFSDDDKYDFSVRKSIFDLYIYSKNILDNYNGKGLRNAQKEIMSDVNDYDDGKINYLSPTEEPIVINGRKYIKVNGDFILKKEKEGRISKQKKAEGKEIKGGIIFQLPNDNTNTTYYISNEELDKKENTEIKKIVMKRSNTNAEENTKIMFNGEEYLKVSLMYLRDLIKKGVISKEKPCYVYPIIWPSCGKVFPLEIDGEKKYVISYHGFAQSKRKLPDGRELTISEENPGCFVKKASEKKPMINY